MKICIIKLGALGDVVRTTPILQAIKEKFPDSEITWITKFNAKEILTNNPNINHISIIPCEIKDSFDILYNLDIEPEATQLASKINSAKKLGYFDNEGFPASFNLSAEYYLNTVFDDELKKTNRKTYQEMIFQTCELEYKKQKIRIFLSEDSKSFANNFFKENCLEREKIIGINIGSSKRWPSKSWDLGKIKEFIEQISFKDYKILILGGKEENEKFLELEKFANQKNLKIYRPDTQKTLKNFFAIISKCDQIISSDTLALHVALAFGKRTTALFFCNTPHEIEGYGNLTKLISPLFESFFPEKMDQYSEQLVNSISVNQVLETLK
ncbi:MAG: glycosyltransferase family 9 protein [Nanoarchaeota archaeon]|nr:glycosyltransferase family 9 protein [Nanoarchaeota archaeon]